MKETNDEQNERLRAVTRRHFFQQTGFGVGSLALSSLLDQNIFAQSGQKSPAADSTSPMAPKPAHFAPRAKSVIYLFMAGGPSQLDLFDYKPKLEELNGQPIPESFTKGERFAFIMGTPRLLGLPHSFQRLGKFVVDISDL